MSALSTFFADGYTAMRRPSLILIPDGTYEVRILDAEERSKRETGALYLHVVYGVEVSGRTRRLPQIIMLRSTSPLAEQTGRRQLDYLCAAVGLDHVSSLRDFIGKILLVDVVTYTRTDTGTLDNRVRRMLPISVAEADHGDDDEIPGT